MKNELTEKEKFDILTYKNINENLYMYLFDKFHNLEIIITYLYHKSKNCNGNIFELMSKNSLEGCCWETSETAILFLDDDAHINRGNLIFEKYKEKYYHSWITFKYNNTNYVFDPCLQIISKEELFNKLFETEILSSIESYKVKDYFNNYIINNKEETKYESFSKELDINHPMYRNHVLYKPIMENNKILSLKAHYQK